MGRSHHHRQCSAAVRVSSAGTSFFHRLPGLQGRADSWTQCKEELTADSWTQCPLPTFKVQPKCLYGANASGKVSTRGEPLQVDRWQALLSSGNQCQLPTPVRAHELQHTCRWRQDPHACAGPGSRAEGSREHDLQAWGCRGRSGQVGGVRIKKDHVVAAHKAGQVSDVVCAVEACVGGTRSRGAG